jgi:hypothetical protein
VETNVILGALGGAFAGWLIVAVFSKGPRTPLEAVRGDYESGGLGCITSLLLIVGGAAVGALIGSGM